MPYKLWYWPSIQGRGEFVRLALEAAEIPYVDAARTEGIDAMMQVMAAKDGRAPFAPPFLQSETTVIGQVAAILMFLGERHDLAPSGMADRMWLNQLQLTIADMVAEVHDVHHPVGMMDYYEDQKAEAARTATQFREQRMPKFLSYFEDATNATRGEWLVGDRWTYADTSLFQLVEGLRYMFPRRMATLEPDLPGLVALRDRVASLPGIRRYLASDRRLPFSTEGIFRHYPELDAA